MRVPEPVLAEIERKLGSSGVAGQLQQRPSPRGGGIVKRVWFERSYVSRLTWPRRFDFLGISVDASFKDTETSSYVVIQAWGCVEAGRYLLGQRRERMTFTETLHALADGAGNGVAERFPEYNVLLIEDKANGSAIIDTLSGKLRGVVAYEPRGSKMARAEAVAPQIEAGDVHLLHPDEDPQTEAFVAEWCAVPSGAFWDQVDATSQFLDYAAHLGTAKVSQAGFVVGERLTVASNYLDGLGGQQ
jgi:predicted phage terminase large subunit-like protein